MKRAALLLLCLFIFPAHADDKSEKIKAEIWELRLQLEAKEAELVRLSPAKEVKFLSLSNLHIGTAGPFGVTLVFLDETKQGIATLQVEQIIDENTMIVSVLIPAGPVATRPDYVPSAKRVVITDTGTEGVKVGTRFVSKSYHVLGTRTIDKQRMALVVPYTPVKKK